MSDRAPTGRKPVTGQSVPWRNQRPPEPLSTGLSPRLTWCEVMQTAAASGHRRVGLSELPETAPSDPTGPRFLVEDIYPSVDGGRYPVKRIAGEPIEVWADLLREGHDQLAAELLWRKESETDWRREPMRLARKRPLAWPIHAARAGPLPVCGRNLDRPVRHLAQRSAAQPRGGPVLTLEAQEGRELLGELNARDANIKRIDRAGPGGSSTASRMSKPCWRTSSPRRSLQATRAAT